MTIIVALSLISLAVVATLLIVGAGTENEDLLLAGVCLLLVWLVAHAGFQAGASWQQQDTMERFNITPKEQHTPA